MNRARVRRWPLVTLGVVALAGLVALLFPGIQPAVDLAARGLAPQAGHWMGTDALGRDVLLAILAGTKRSMTISMGAALLGGIIGVALGSVSGYFGNNLLRPSARSYVSGSLALAAFVFCAFVVWPVARLSSNMALAVLIPLGLLCVIALLHLLFKKRGLLEKRASFPFDQSMQRFTEVFTVIPRLYLILIFSVVVPINLFTLIVLFAITSWDTMSRLIRAEMLKVQAMTYIESARIIGLTEWQVFFRHALPNAVGPVFTQLCFTIANLLIAEATLSFLGVGISPEVVSWGSIIHGYLENLQAWWLAFFPGLFIYATVVSLHALADDLDALYHARS